MPSITPITLIGYVFATAVTFSCVRHLAKGGLKEDMAVFKGRSLVDWAEMIAGDLLSIAALFGCYYLSTFGPKFLHWSWISLLATKGEQPQGANQMIVGATIPYFGIAFLLLLFVNLPRLAANEEEVYRDGTKNWLDAIPRSLRFGLMHMIVGVPLWCGLALSLPGLWFTRQYFKGGVERSTMAHAIYNMMLASVLLVFVVLWNFGAVS
jgi:hypothetical protein